jgi:hypothetical protein
MISALKTADKRVPSRTFILGFRHTDAIFQRVEYFYISGLWILPESSGFLKIKIYK